MKTYFVYILQSNNGNAMYIGVTNDLVRRFYEHKSDLIDGFTKRYKCKKLVYFEQTESVDSAILREKQLKKWSRKKKEALIMRTNPTFLDLSTTLEMTE